MQMTPVKGFGLFGAATDPSTPVTLLDETQVNYGDITFDPSTYSFYYDQADIGTTDDITDTVPYNIKLTFPGFDPVKNNDMYAARQQGKVITPATFQQLDTSTASLFVDNVGNELGGAAAGINKVISNPSSLVTGSLGATLGLVLGGAVLLYIFSKKK